MNYPQRMEKAKTLLAQNHCAEAVQVAAGALESVLVDLYNQLLGESPPDRQKALVEAQERVSSGQPLNKLTLGKIVGVYRASHAQKDLRSTLGLNLRFLDVDALDPLVETRNRATHSDYEPDPIEAAYVVNQVELILREVGFLPTPSQPQGGARPVQNEATSISSDSPRKTREAKRALPRQLSEREQDQSGEQASRPQLLFSQEHWADYATSLQKSLELEQTKFRVPVDILANRVAKHDQQMMPGKDEREEHSWLDTAVATKERLTVLLGDPGEGKTVCFTTLAKRLLEEFQVDSAAPLPVGVRLALYDQHQSSLKELIADQFRQNGLSVADASLVPDLLTHRHFFLLLDGLNELPEHTPLIRELNSIMSHASGSRFFLSCRLADYDRVREPLPAHAAWRLMRFSAEDIQAFFEQYLEEDPGRKERIKGWLADERLMEVLGTPFFLSLFARLDPADVPSPKNRAELCQLFVDSFQERELKSRPDLRSAGDLWTALEETAYKMQDLQEIHLPAAQFDAMIRQAWLEQFYGQETTAPLDAKLQALYTSPLLTRETGMVSFTHQLFRDFFAARALSKKTDLGDAATLARFVSNPWWDHTLVLLSGLLPIASQVLYAMIYEGSRYELAFRCLLESKRIDYQVLQDVVEWFRQGRRMLDLYRLGPLVAGLPDQYDAWRLAEAESIVRTALTDEDGDLGVYGSAYWWRVFKKSEWRLSDDMALRAAEDALQATSEIERGNAVSLLLVMGKWERIIGAVNDPSPHVRKTLAQSIAQLYHGDVPAEELQSVAAKLSEDPEVDVRCAAMEAAGTIAEVGGTEILRAGLQDPNANVRLAALKVLMDAEGEWVKALRSEAVILLRDFLEQCWLGEWPDAGENDQLDWILDALASIETVESSDELFRAVLLANIDPVWVASILAARGDMRALAALAYGMWSWPTHYLSDSDWLDSIEEAITSLLPHPFKLAWLEAFLIPRSLQEKLLSTEGVDSGRFACIDPLTALQEMVEISRGNKSAHSFLVWALFMAFGPAAYYCHVDANLLESAMVHLVQIDPGVLTAYFDGSRKLYDESWDFPVGAEEVARWLLDSAAVLKDQLPQELKGKLLRESEQ